MESIVEKKEAHMRPYDDSAWDIYSMYDKTPYLWNRDLNVDKVFRKVSGNIIKAYRCKIEEPIEVKHE